MKSGEMPGRQRESSRTAPDSSTKLSASLGKPKSRHERTSCSDAGLWAGLGAALRIPSGYLGFSQKTRAEARVYFVFSDWAVGGAGRCVADDRPTE